MDRAFEVLVTPRSGESTGNPALASVLIFPTRTHSHSSISPSFITFPVFSTFPPQKTVQGLVFKLRVFILKHPKEKLHCKKLTNQMPAHNILLQLREFLEQYQKNAESAENSIKVFAPPLPHFP